jgi:glycerol kinase
MAGLAAGVWNGMQDFPAVETDLAAEPSLAERARAALRNRWSEALTLTAGGRP